MIEGRVSVGGNIFICILFFSLPFSFLSKESVESGRDKDWLVVCVYTVGPHSAPILAV